MKISVLIRAHNSAATMARAIDSVLGQTHPEIEMVVVDDASTDDTLSVIHGYKDSRIVSVRHEKNLGAAQAGLTALRHSSGPLVAGLDSDDAARPRWLECLHAAILEDKSVGMVWGAVALRRANGHLFSVAFRNPWSTNAPVSPTPGMLTWTPGIGGVMYRKSMLEETGFLEPGITIDDLELSIRIARSRKWKVRVVRDVIMDVFKGPASLSGTVDERYAESLARIIEKHSDLWGDFPNAGAYYHYRAARAYFCLARKSEGMQHLEQAISLAPETSKYRAYKLAQHLGLRKLWDAMSVLRTKWDERKRLRAFRRLEAGG